MLFDGSLSFSLFNVTCLVLRAWVRSGERKANAGKATSARLGTLSKQHRKVHLKELLQTMEAAIAMAAAVVVVLAAAK